MWWWYCWYCCRSFKKLANRNALLFCQLKLLLEQTTRRAAQNANQTNRQSGRLADRLQYHGKPSRLLLLVVVLLLMCETQLRVGCPTTPVRPSLRARASPDAHKTTNHDKLQLPSCRDRFEITPATAVQGIYCKVPGTY